jgi:CBS domain-containing protein
MSQRICPSCGYDNIPGSDECAECQTSLTQEDIPPEVARDRVEKGLIEKFVSDLEQVTPITVPEETPLDQAIAQMRSAGIGCLLVTDSAGKLSGIVSERDFLNRVVLEVVDLEQGRIADFMTPNPETIEPERTLGFALQRMMVGDLRHLPLVDKDGRPAGIISSRDVIRHIAHLIEAD